MFNLLNPLISFHVYGTFCCKDLYISFHQQYFEKEKFIFNTNIMLDANIIFLWGSFNEQLISLIKSQVVTLPKKIAFVHIKGCHESNIEQELTIDLSYMQCSFDNQKIKNIITDIRQCFKK